MASLETLKVNDMATISDWRILGAGALGCLWASYLRKSGRQVELLLKDAEVLRQYRQVNAITFISNDQKEQLTAGTSVVDQGDAGIEHLLITTKAHQTMTAMQEVAPRLSPECRLLLMQNGMGVAEQIAGAFPEHPLFCGVTTDGAYCPEPFTVVHAGKGNTFIGAYRNLHNPQTVIEQLPTDYLEIRPCNDIETRQWRKLAINCAVNGLTVIHHCRNGELLNIAAARSRLVRLCDEIARLGAVLGFTEWANTLYADTENVIRMTGANYSSMYQDIDNRRLTEIDYINGFLIRQAERHGIACPENEALYRDIKQKEVELGCEM